jgi:hypothetical protein
MQIARQSAALVVLHRHEPDRQTPQFFRPLIGRFFQYGGAVAN